MAMMTTAIFDRREDAQRAVHALRDHGVDEEKISVLAVADDGSGKISDLDHEERVPAPGKDEGISTTTPQDAAKGAAEGAAIGAGLGLVAALSSLFIPGFGLLTGGGALATALWGAAGATAGGAVAGGVTGFLADMGVPAQTARDYEEAIKKGGVLVAVHQTDEATTGEIQQIFVKYHGHSAGGYADIVESGAPLATPQRLDETNDRLRQSDADLTGGSEGITIVKTRTDAANERLNETGDLSRTDVSPSAGNIVATTAPAMQRDTHLDAATGDEGSASSRLGDVGGDLHDDVRIGPAPNDFGASTEELEGTTNAVIDTGNVGSTTSGLGEMDADEVRVRTEPPESPSANLTGTLGGNVGGVGGVTGGLTGGLGSSVGDQPGTAGGTNVVGDSGAMGGSTAVLYNRDEEDPAEPINTREDMTGKDRDEKR
ncbi:MAG: hypothetical protein KY468_09595 [Armatimonadetes bacterium]|nr:hypothetical protein [Armatimonadota bacterium]